MTKLERLYTDYGQSPWLDNLTRGYLRDGTLARMVADGIRGSPPTRRSSPRHRRFARLRRTVLGADDGRQLGRDAYWELVIADIDQALAVLRPVFDAAAASTDSSRWRWPPSWPTTPGTIAAARGYTSVSRSPTCL